LVEHDLPGVEVDVGPAQPERFASPASGRSEEQPRRLVSIVLNQVEEPTEGRASQVFISGDFAWADPGGWAACATLRAMRSQATASRRARPMIVWM
jgi:hypothetical protein